MTKRKGIISKAVLVLALLTLISCCFLGYTFARYTSSVSGTATVTVAKWEVTLTDSSGNENAFESANTVTMGTVKLSPSAEDYDYDTTSTARSNSTSNAQQLGTITNKSEVAALLTVEADTTNSTVTYGSSQTASGSDTLTSFTIGETTYDITAADVINLFTFTLCKDANGTAYDESDLTLAASTGSLDVYCVVTWTSADDKGEAYADALDTWVGENVASISLNVNIKAVQASEING